MQTALRSSLIVLFFAVLGCGSQHPDLYKHRIEVSGYDFTEYTEEGFLITPEGYSGEYESIGVLNVTVWPTVEELHYENAPPLAEPISQGSGGHEDWYITDPITTQDAVDSLYVLADSMGADAIINFETETLTQELEGNVTRPGIRARGFAIDRTQ